MAAAILCKALQADYWKPIQAGDLENSDSKKVAQWIPGVRVHPEAYQLSQSMSPHAAAIIDQIKIEEEALIIPETESTLIIELAGGIMVPLRSDYLNINWVEKTGLSVVLVADYYLGSINHTLLTWELLKSRGIPVIGIIFNGEKNLGTFEVILQRTQAKCLLQISREKEIRPIHHREICRSNQLLVLTNYNSTKTIFGIHTLRSVAPFQLTQ